MSKYILTINYKKGAIKETTKYFNNAKEAKEEMDKALYCMLFANDAIEIDSVSLEELH